MQQALTRGALELSQLLQGGVELINILRELCEHPLCCILLPLVDQVVIRSLDLAVSWTIRLVAMMVIRNHQALDMDGTRLSREPLVHQSCLGEGAEGHSAQVVHIVEDLASSADSSPHRLREVVEMLDIEMGHIDAMLAETQEKKPCLRVVRGQLYVHLASVAPAVGVDPLEDECCLRWLRICTEERPAELSQGSLEVLPGPILHGRGSLIHRNLEVRRHGGDHIVLHVLRHIGAARGGEDEEANLQLHCHLAQIDHLYQGVGC
mmetsp:Transcript_53801/g.114869  ORF Transcript_53801/g.114869 Transcript_53801/m.114869 type:complete len:264 (+) Transcript_53801:442-1233(+)